MGKKIIGVLFVLLIMSALFSMALADDGFMTHQLIEIEFPYGVRTGYYTGSTVDGIPSGYGLFESQNSSGQKWHYIGQFEKGTFNGNGSSYWEFDSDHETGIYKDGSMTEGDMYTAETTALYQGLFSGNGSATLEGKVYNSRKQLVFEGKIENGLFISGTLYNANDGSVAAQGEFGDGFYQFIKNNYIQNYTY